MRIACWIPKSTNTHSSYVMPVGSYSSVCRMFRFVAFRARIRANRYTDLGLCKYSCASTPVQVRLCKYACASTPVQVRLCKYVCASTPVQVRLCKYACASTSVQVRLCKYSLLTAFHFVPPFSPPNRKMYRKYSGPEI